MNDKRFAVLIDADNVSSKYIKLIMDEITNEGIVTYKRIYGDWTSPNLNPWKKVLLESSVTPMQQYSYTTGKNSTDSALIIDAMDILYTGKVDGFCIVSSDSDFTKLASRLREAGMLVIGMGQRQTPRPFVSACNQFKYLDLLSEETKLPPAEPEGKRPVPQPVKPDSKKSVKENESDSTQTPINELRDSIFKMIEENSNDDGWMLVSQLGSMLQKKYSDFDCRLYGYKKMVLLLRGLNFETKNCLSPNNKDNPTGYDVFVRIPSRKPNPALGTAGNPQSKHRKKKKTS